MRKKAAGSFWHKPHRKYRRRIDIITIEEFAWLAIGILSGWLIGQGLILLILVIPLALFALFIYEKHIYASRYGLRTIAGKKI